MGGCGVSEGNGTIVGAEFRALLDAAVDAIIVTDEVGTILEFNSAAERLFGHRASDVIGRGVELLMPEPDRSRHAGYMRRYLETGEAKIIGIGRDVLARRASGEVFPIALSVGEAVSGDRRRFVGIMRDLSRQRAQERHSRALESRLAHVGRFSLMGEMAAGIAHEINQPLSAIATYAQAAKRLVSREPVRREGVLEICEKIDEQARRAGQVIENFRKFIRNQEIHVEPVDVNQAIDAVWNLIEADARAEGIDVSVRYGEGLPRVRGNAVQLQQVLLNLTRNAVDAMRDGLHKRKGIRIETSRMPDGRVRIAVVDHGPGVSRSLGSNVFHPFVTTKKQGLGVGLAISRTIVQAYGGTLSFSDNPDGGAVFTVDLAIEQGEPRER